MWDGREERLTPEPEPCGRNLSDTGRANAPGAIRHESCTPTRSRWVCLRPRTLPWCVWGEGGTERAWWGLRLCPDGAATADVTRERLLFSRQKLGIHVGT